MTTEKERAFLDKQVNRAGWEGYSIEDKARDFTDSERERLFKPVRDRIEAEKLEKRFSRAYTPPKGTSEFFERSDKYEARIREKERVDWLNKRRPQELVINEYRPKYTRDGVELALKNLKNKKIKPPCSGLVVKVEE